MPIELRSWLNPQSYSNSYSTAPMARDGDLLDRAGVLAYHDLGIGVITLGGHVTGKRDAELRAETLRLIKQSVAVRDAAAPAGRGTTAA
jgi:hypothetical protein